MGLEVWVYAGLATTEGVEVDSDGYPRDWERFWRAAVVEGTEYSYPGRAEGLEQDAIYAYTAYAEFQAGSTKTYQAWRIPSRAWPDTKALKPSSATRCRVVRS